MEGGTAVKLGPIVNVLPESLLWGHEGYSTPLWIVRSELAIQFAPGARERVPDAFIDFLRAVDTMTHALPDGKDYIYGTAYFRVIDAATADPGGTWHYDTGKARPELVRHAGRPVLRFTAATSTDPRLRVSNAFTSDECMAGVRWDDPYRVAAGSTHPENGQVCMFSEGTDLHVRPSREAWFGASIAFFSATLYTPHQTPDLSCPALAQLRQPAG